MLAQYKYDKGDFVTLEQYIVKTPGCLPTHFGQKSHTKMFHGGTIFRDAASKYIHMSNQVSWDAGKQLTVSLLLRNGFGKPHKLA